MSVADERDPVTGTGEIFLTNTTIKSYFWITVLRDHLSCDDLGVLNKINEIAAKKINPKGWEIFENFS